MSKENVTEGVCIDIYNLLKFRDDAYNAITDVCAHCSDLTEKVEELERQHKADQKAVEEANQIAEAYMKRCQELYEQLNKAKKPAGDVVKPVMDMLNRVQMVKGNFDTSGLAEKLNSRITMVFSNTESGSGIPTRGNIEKVLKDEKLKYLKSYSTKELVDELSKREGVSRKDIEPHSSDIGYFEGPAIVLTVID